MGKMGLGLSGSEAEKNIIFPTIILNSKPCCWNEGCTKAITTLRKTLDASVHNCQLIADIFEPGSYVRNRCL